ncbi:helix-turn-helix domain-containing protein [Radiobacillus sp. PE A8.2]|uniref:AraC family transcriptional regulator n=1 Tax=Radiobacillus sp. PE A8.2 TaxID=3380349 RepID=UPI00388F9605
MVILYENRGVPFSFFSTANLTFHAHFHQQIEILFVLDGEVNVCINGTDKVLNVGDLAIAFPNAIHQYETEQYSQVALLIFSMDIAGDFSTNLLKYESPSPFLSSNKVHKDIPYCIKAFQEQPQIKNMDVRLMKGYITVMLSRIFENLNLQEICNRHQYELTHQTLVYITNHFKEPITLEHVAKQIGASKYHLSRIFSKNIRSNFNTYLNALRINHAQYLLSESQLNITEIAFESGFESPRTFYRAFQSLCHTTPTAFRKKTTNNNTVS